MKLHLVKFVELIATQDQTLLDEGDFEDFIKLVMYSVSLMVSSWHQVLKKFYHVFCVNLILPLVDTALPLIPLKLKEFLESLHKLPIEKPFINLNLDILWQLVTISLVILRLRPGHLIVCPVELKKVFKLVLKILIQQSAAIVLGQKSHKHGQTVSIFVVLSQHLEFIYDLHKYAHDE